MGIARNTNDELYVAGGGSSNIVKFDTLGNVIGTITHSDLTGPQGIAFDDRGHFFSSSFFQNKIVEFDENDNYVQTITDGNLNVPRSIAFEPLIPVTSIEEQQLPTGFVLNQNYPNPFNPSTIISWEVPVGSWQTLKIYDVLGNEVATLVNEYKPAGKYEVEFNPASSIKHPASGVYFYQLRAGNFIETKKMILLK